MKQEEVIEFGTRNQQEVTEDRDNKTEENKEVEVGIIMNKEEVIEIEESVSSKAGGDSGRNINNNIQNPRPPRQIVKNIYLFDTDDEDEGLYSPGGPRSDEEDIELESRTSETEPVPVPVCFSCYVCDGRFESDERLELHLRQTHDISRIRIDEESVVHQVTVRSEENRHIASTARAWVR